MANPRFFKDAFDSLATDNAIGESNGRLAYCYLRVSSTAQAEEGASGLPRQLQHIHEVAAANGYKVPWSHVYADDHTGFEFRGRPALSQLRAHIKQTNRDADTIIIESLDRLSRNADWHQGYLLDEMKEYGLNVLFWKSFSSRIERAVLGAISQDGMEQEKRRMAEGNVIKAESGRITARQRAYGYIFVDSDGNESAKAKKDTHYAPHQEEAEVIRLIFRRVAAGESMRGLAAYLEERYPPPKNYKHWVPKQLALFIRNPLYKGEFVARRFQEVKVPKPGKRPGDPVQFVKRKVERPRDEWIVVAVPPLVGKDVWTLANRMLDQNKRTSRRNAKEPFLLTGLVDCATCGSRYVGTRKTERRERATYSYTYYRCSARGNIPIHMIREKNCNQGMIACHRLDDAVWACICQALLEPQLLLEYLDSELEDERNSGIIAQIRYLERHISDKEKEDEKLYKAYMADVFDETEYRQRRQLLSNERENLAHELSELQRQELTREEIEDRKELILALARRASQNGLTIDAPFEVKSRVIRLVVDRIVFDKPTESFTLEGILPGTYFLADIVGISMDRDSWQRQT